MMEEKNNDIIEKKETGTVSDELELRAVHSEHTYRKPPKEKKAKKPRIGITHSSAAKTIAFILCILMLCVTAVSVFAVAVMFETDVYWTDKEDQRHSSFYNHAENFASNAVYRMLYSGYDADLVDSYISREPIAYIKVESTAWNFDVYEREISDPAMTFVIYVLVKYDKETGKKMITWCTVDEPALPNNEYDEYYTVNIGIPNELPVDSELYWMNLVFDLLYAFKFWIYAIGLGSFIIAILCFVFLMCSAGRRRGMPGVRASFLTKIPFEIPTAAVFFASLLGFALIGDWFYYNDVIAWIAFVVWAIVSVIMLIFWFMSLALRIKLGTLLKNTIVFYILRFIWRALCFCGRCIRTVVRSLPMIWKTVLLIGAVAVIELFIIAATNGETDNLLIWWFIGTVISSFFIIYFVLMLRRLQKGARKIADGMIDYKVDTKYLILDLKDHGNDLNRIGDGMNIAVEERLKSERMKTELITNVSHDIKTPLTSIINYSDLICREECENENIKEYASVLHNQSERMKRLLDDLVEASKASSGNIDIMLAECDARVMISQVSGEYYQRLSDAGLDLVCSTPDDEIKIMADGRRLWRVFDNLMNNARKYALSGTRVYVSLEAVGERAVFRFKNISRDPISVQTDELAERFVRGDESRGTEGNGLGLSIAKSLTELQGGVFDITVDGDLFKVTVSFPIVK